MSFSSDRVRKVSFAAHALPATRAYSTSHDFPNSPGTHSRRKSSLARRDVLFNLKQRAEQRRSVSKQQDSLRTRSLASIQRSIDTQRGSRKYSNTPFTALSDFPDNDDVVDRPASDLDARVRHGSNTKRALKVSLSSAGLPSDHSHVSSVLCPVSPLAPPLAAEETSKPSASSQSSIFGLGSERFRNTRVPQEIDTLAIELNNAYLTVQAAWTMSHAILLYYQGRGAEMLKELTRTTMLAERRGDVETMVRAQLWKAIILNDMGEVENMPQLLGDVVDALLQSGCGDDGDFYQLNKLWLQYSDAIIAYLTDEYMRQSGHSLTEAKASAQRTGYQRQLAKITVLLATKFDHSEWPNPTIAYNAGHLKYDPHAADLPAELDTKLKRLRGINRKLQKENCDLKMNNIRYQEERRAIPHLSTAYSNDGRFPFRGYSGHSQQHAGDIVEDPVTPGPISALMKQLGQEPCHQLPASVQNVSSGPASQWLAHKYAERRQSSSSDQSPSRPRWGSSSVTQREYSRKSSKASFSPTDPVTRRHRYQSPRRASSWGSTRYPRPLRVRNAGQASSGTSSSRSKVCERKASGFDNSRGLLPVSNSALGYKAANSWRGNQLGGTFKRATTDILSTLRTVPRSTVQRRRQPSENPSPHTRCYPPTQSEPVMESFLEDMHPATDLLSGPPVPPARSLHGSRKQSLTSPTNTSTPELVPLTDALAPSQLEAELPQLHENQERRRRSMPLSSSSPTSPSSTCYDHERRRSLFEYQQRHGAAGHSVQANKPHNESQDKEADVSSRSSMPQSNEPPYTVSIDGESVSISMRSDPKSSVRSPSSKPPSLRSNTSAKSKSRDVIVGIGTAPGTPSSKTPPSSAICMPSMATSSSGNDGRPSSVFSMWTGFSAHAPDFTPRRPTKPNALRPQRSNEKFTPPPFQATEYNEQDPFPYNEQTRSSHEADVAGRTSSKDIRISLFLSQLETEQATTLDRARRTSKPVISSPLRRSSQVGEDDDDGEQRGVTTAPMSPDSDRAEEPAAGVQKLILYAPETARHDDDKRHSGHNTQVNDADETDDREQRRSVREAIEPTTQAKASPSSLEKEPTASESDNYSRGSSQRTTSEQAVKLIEKEEKLEQMAKAQSVPGGLESAAKLTDWQRFVEGEDWRNARSRFPRQIKQQGPYRIGSFAARGMGEGQRPSKASIRPRMDSRELPDVHEQRWKKLSDEVRDEVPPRAKNSKSWTLDNSAGDSFSDEKRTQDETSNLDANRLDGRQDMDALNRGAPRGTEKLESPERTQNQDVSNGYAGEEQEYDGSVSSMSDSEEPRLPAGPAAAERNETQPRGSAQSQTQLEFSRPGHENYRVQNTDGSRVPARSKRYNNTFGQANYEEINHSYPSPTSPQQHFQEYSQLRGCMPAKLMAHHNRSAQRDRGPMDQGYNGVSHDALAGRMSSLGDSDCTFYSFSGFSGVYSPATRSTQSRADAQIDGTVGMPIGCLHQYQYLPSTTYRYQPQMPMQVQPSTRQQEETGQIWHPSGAPRSNTKVPRESVWEDQRRAFDEQEKKDEDGEEDVAMRGSIDEQQVGEQSEDEDGEGNEQHASSPDTALNFQGARGAGVV